jgi:lipoprotein-releasing system ATP-binding protein
MTSAAPLLSLREVSRRFGSPDGATPVTVLEGLSLELGAGESLAIVGPSGSGKSTLLHLIGTLDRPDSGSILLSGQDLARLDQKQVAAVRSRQIGFVFQAHYLLPQCSVLENVLVPTLALAQNPATSSSRERPAEPAEARARRLLQRVGLEHRLAHHPGQLSGGERQRVAVVRALINQPQLLLADEPTGALDHASAQQLAQLLLELNREEGVALVLVTHALDLARRMQRVFQLNHGRLTALAV